MDWKATEIGRRHSPEIERKLKSTSYTVGRACFSRAREFHLTAFATMKVVQPYRLSVPAIVNLAFAIELYLKTLLQIDGGRHAGHDLGKLFAKLKADVSTQVEEIYARLSPDTVFQSDLAELASTFATWRYLHECVDDGIEPEAVAVLAPPRMCFLAYALHEVIRIRRPDWNVDQAGDAKLREAPSVDLMEVVVFSNGWTFRMIRGSTKLH